MNNIDFMDALNFILSETNFDKEFFIVYDRKLKKVLPYIYTEEEDQNKSNTNPKNLYFQISFINIKDKNKYYLIHSSELSKDLFNKEAFISKTITNITKQCLKENENTSGVELNIINFFEKLKTAFNLTEHQIKEIYSTSEVYELFDYHPYDDIKDGEYILFQEGYPDYIDSEFLELQDEVKENILFLLKHDKSVENSIRISMINELNKNKNIIEDEINQRLSKLLDVIEPENKQKEKLKI